MDKASYPIESLIYDRNNDPSHNQFYKDNIYIK